LFDVYLSWARVESSFAATSNPPSATALTSSPILLQYIFFLALNALATLAHHLTVRLLVRMFLSTTTSQIWAELPETGASGKFDKRSNQGKIHSTDPTSETNSRRTVGPGLAFPSAISTALLVSSCTKLFPLLLVIWPESTPSEMRHVWGTPSFASRARRYVGWAVLLNNVEALLILLDCGYITAAALALAGMTARWVVEGAVLSVAGLKGESGPVGDIFGLMNNTFRMFLTGPG
jgi:lipid intermediate transporter